MGEDGCWDYIKARTALGDNSEVRTLLMTREVSLQKCIQRTQNQDNTQEGDCLSPNWRLMSSPFLRDFSRGLDMRCMLGIALESLSQTH